MRRPGPGIGRGNGTSTTFTWNTGSRLIGLSHDLPGTTWDQAFSFAYNPAGQIVEREATNDLYAYTADPNLVDAYTINGLNQVTAIDSTTVTYDADGNLTNDGTTVFDYDAFNRLTGAGSADFTFDAAGRLYDTTAGSATRRFLYAGAQAIAEYNGAGKLVQRYVPGLGIDGYAAYVTPNTNRPAGRTYPLADQLGSVIALTDPSGAAGQINAYDEYGVPAPGNSGPFGYTGQMFTPEAGTAPWHYRARQYHPTLGRFLQPDPIGYAAGMNLYAYVADDPINWIDPSGLEMYRIRYLACRIVEGARPEMVSKPQIIVCEWRYREVELNFSRWHEGFGTNMLLERYGLPRGEILGRVCGRGPSGSSRAIGIAEATSAGGHAHDSLGRIAESGGGRIAARAFLPLSIAFQSVETGAVIVDSRQRGEPWDLTTARAGLPLLGSAGGALAGGAAGSAVGGPVGTIVGGSAGALAGDELGEDLAEAYRDARCS